MTERSKRGTPHDEPPSELIQLDSEIASIPAHAEFAATPEELRQKKLVRWMKIGAVLFAVIAVAAVAFIVHRQGQREEALQAAFDHGRVADFESALALHSDESVRAYLAGALALELPATELTSERLAEIEEGAGDDSRESQLASVYLALLQGDAKTARETAEALTLVGDLAPEMIFAQSIAAEAVGQIEQAAARAGVALQLRQGSTRYRARYANTLTRVGRPDEALALLASADADASDIAVARARALLLTGDLDGALASASGVTQSEQANPAEVAWASLVTATARAARGDRGTALEAASKAQTLRPAADEWFTILLAEAFLAVAEPTRAAEILGAEDPAVSTAPVRRSLARGLATLDAAAASLAQTLPQGPERSLLMGAIAEARAEHDAAVTAYGPAAGAPLTRQRALSGLARVELARGRPAAALAHAEALLAASPNHPDYATLAVAALGASNELDAARRVLAASEAAHPGDIRLAIARGRLHLAASEWSKALEVLSAAAERAPDDAALQVDLGDAARRSGDAQRAKAAYAKAIELRPDALGARLGLLELALDAHDLAAAKEQLARVDALVEDAPSLRVHHLRARYLVATGAGEAGLETLAAALRAHRDDGALRLAQGELYLQEESFDRAARAFESAASQAEVDSRAALGGAALAYGRGGKRGSAKRVIEALDDAIGAERASAPQRSDEARVRMEARELVARARYGFLSDKAANGRRHLRRALELDANHGDALLLSVELASDDGATPEPAAVRAAAEARPPQPAARALLAVSLGATAEGCALGRAYMKAAPRGAHARTVQALVAQCGD